jgi:uncharacterized repeat protein (TIGR03803 family)
VTATGTLTTLCNLSIFETCTTGTLPWAGVVLATNGYFYGTTSAGGANGWGTVFKMTPGGALTTLYSFCTKINCGVAPNIGLVQASNGNLYGTTQAASFVGSPGTIFQITPEGQFKTIYTFCAKSVCRDGESPGGPLIQGTDGYLYGTTGAGGIGYGSIFKITTGGQLTTLYRFTGTDGATPFGPMVQASDGNFYGTTTEGGTGFGCNAGCGTIFKMTPGGTLTTLHSFSGPDGSFPIAGLIQGTDGNFYGVTEEGGGSTNCSTFGCGTIFEFTPPSTLTTLHIFEAAPDGASPSATLLQATSGAFYGTSGGGNCGGIGCGIVFSVSMGLHPFVSFVQRAGKVGQTAEILGQGFKGTTGVSFNGVPAGFAFQTDTYLTATVPSGATTGNVTVTTPHGTLTSNVPFRVIK